MNVSGVSIDIKSTPSVENTIDLEKGAKYIKTVHGHKVDKEVVSPLGGSKPHVITIPDSDDTP